ncbi:hypothetical protein BASA81_000960 [Batrachochytrium salamandrivorans]|nr:hypothetical protein BASA81_000960 [Batrachochytrium salamandrivorans]
MLAPLWLQLENDTLNPWLLVRLWLNYEIVGRPLAAMLANDGAHVMSVDIDSVYGMQRGKMTKAVDATTTQACVEKSSVVILGVPTKDFKLNCEWLKRSGQERVIVVNVSHFKNIDEAALYEANPNAVYVPLVGQVTVAMLERNLLRLIDSFVGKDIKSWKLGEGSPGYNYSIRQLRHCLLGNCATIVAAIAAIIVAIATIVTTSTPRSPPSPSMVGAMLKRHLSKRFGIFPSRILIAAATTGIVV